MLLVLLEAVHKLFDLVLPILYKHLLLPNQLINTLLILEKLVVLAVVINEIGWCWLDCGVL